MVMLKGHAVEFRTMDGGEIELYVDGEFEGVFKNRGAAIEYVETEIEEKR